MPLVSGSPGLSRAIAAILFMRKLLKKLKRFNIIYITVEAATLIGLTFVAAASYILRIIMARKKSKGGPPSTGSPATQGADAKGPAPSRPASVAAPVMKKEADARPETSPYGSPSCTVPFASPLTVALDILKKSPKLHAAYELRLPELTVIPEPVGHVLVHYLHTRTYEALKPQGADKMSKQLSELRTAIQAYAAARAYELPGLMRLCEGKITKFGEGLPLPSLLEVARDAYPTLTDSDDWFLDYLRSRIRPHLRDPEVLMGSNLLEQISSILSPNKVLLRTVLELFCERIVGRPESPAPAASTQQAASAMASPVTSPSSSRPVTPLPASAAMSMLEMRSRSVPRSPSTPPSRKNTKGSPWPSPDHVLEDSSSLRAASPEPAFEIKPMPASPTPGPFLELGPVIMDVVPSPGSSTEANAEAEPQVKAEAEAEAEPETKVEAEPEVEVEAEAEAEREDGATGADPAAVAQSERRDSGKDIELELPSRELQTVPEHMSELEAQFNPQPQSLRPAAREADSGFWEGPDAEASKEPSIVEIQEPVSTLVPIAEPVHELESNVDPKEGTSVHIRDFADSDKTEMDNKADTQAEHAQEPVSERVAENTPDAVTGPAVEEAEDKSADATAQTSPAEGEPREAKGKEVEAQPETEKAQEESVEPQVVAKVQPEPETTPSDKLPVPDDAQPAGSAEAKAAEPSIEPGTKPPGEPKIHRAYTDSAILAAARADDAADAPAVLGAQPAAEQDGAKADADAAGNQSCSPQVRQKGWKKRFMSIRYPLMFGRGM
ncbi:uncharacterized protein B0T15DRAFT_491767 [Chaetomium strumarium]|uniref:Uncharacterized protein n=1 Tax=Chaetomium strumarium TaxID=1170767 RepID=A0AAJ0H0G2_9PEZI|nr:hypothetical protein B0T15DRAFT_491767 [Chaetomium strumarium]